MTAPEETLTNSQIAELLALAGEDAKPPLNRAYRRASRKALLWEEESAGLHQEGRALTELPAVGPYLARIIRKWIQTPPIVPSPPPHQGTISLRGRRPDPSSAVSRFGRKG